MAIIVKQKKQLQNTDCCYIESHVLYVSAPQMTALYQNLKEIGFCRNIFTDMKIYTQCFLLNGKGS